MAMESEEELARRRNVVATGQVDLERWRDLGNFQSFWDTRAEAAAKLLPVGVTVLDVGCGRMSLEKFLPPESRYLPSDLFPRDARTLVCDLNREPLPRLEGIGALSALGVLEYLQNPVAFYEQARALQVPFVTSYHPVQPRHPIDRAGCGWVNALSLPEWLHLAESAGFQLRHLQALNHVEYLAAFWPE